MMSYPTNADGEFPQPKSLGVTDDAKLMFLRIVQRPCDSLIKDYELGNLE
jgi:hypothetical protein